MAKGKYRRPARTSVSSFRRRIAGVEATGSAILVVTEGVNTEPAYYNTLKRRFAAPTVELVAYGKGAGDPRVLTDVALELRKERRREAKANELPIDQPADFDELWIVFDADVLTSEKLNNGIAYAGSKGVGIALSQPCFEFWLLLHDGNAYTTAPMAKCANVVPYLKRAYGWTSYSKNAADVEDLIAPLVEKTKVRTAIQAAEKVRNHHASAGTPFPANPSTDVDQLIRSINGALPISRRFL